ncbi:MAG: hypothetical protein NVSMB1_24480 [Polyangiales bacterium]
MFAFIFRRLLSTAPALLGFIIVLFIIIAEAPPQAGLSDEELARRFSHLPLLLNVAPQDRPRIVSAIIMRLPTLGEAARHQQTEELLTIGAVGLGDIVAALDRLPQGIARAERARISRGLAPLAFRMGLDDVADLDQPAKAEGYFRRVYDERGAELRETQVRRALQRHLRERSEPLYARQLRNADTAALRPLIEALDSELSQSDREEVESLGIEAARRAGARQVTDGASFKAWWTAHHAESISFDASDRVAARITETRFCRWVSQAVMHRFGKSWRTGEPVLDDIGRRAPKTLLRVIVAIALAYAFAIPLAMISAARRNGPSDRVSRWVTILLYAFPAFATALVLRAALPRAVAGSTIVVLALSSVSVATISRHARAVFLEVIPLDCIRTARSMGIDGLALWCGPIVRTAFAPLLAFASLQIPFTLAASVVVEDALGVDGLGRAMIEALRARDVPWLMALSLIVAVLIALLLATSDLMQARLDPRIARSLSLRHSEGDMT